MESVFIDVSGEGLPDSSDVVLQTVIAEHLGLPLDQVQARWVVLSLVGGMEGIAPAVVQREVGVLQTQIPELAGLRPVIIIQEYREAAPVAANCAFACRVQTLTGCEPTIIGVIQTGNAWRWRVDYTFPPEGSPTSS